MYSQIFKLNAELLKAIAHPRRLEIIHLLRDQELKVTEIHTMLDLPQANISQHLMILRDNNIVTCRKQGKEVYYKLSSKKIIKACDLLREFLIEKNKNSKLLKQLKISMTDLVPVVQDPVCHMRVSPKTAGFHYHYKNEDYYFCASACLARFKKDPEIYAK